jgi:hypothetical protein
MEQTLFDGSGKPVAYICTDYQQTIFLWDGRSAAYLYEDQHVYGINGRHLGWYVDGVVYTNEGERIGFTAQNCPVNIAKEPAKTEKRPPDEIRPRWKAPPFPKIAFVASTRSLEAFFEEGMVPSFSERPPAEAISD